MAPWQQPPGLQGGSNPAGPSWSPGGLPNDPRAAGAPAVGTSGVRLLPPPAGGRSNAVPAAYADSKPAAPGVDNPKTAAEPIPPPAGLPPAAQNWADPAPGYGPSDNDGYDCWGSPLCGPDEARCLCGLCGRIWVKTEYLMWWPRGAWTPPLLTTGTTASGGVLGQPGTSLLVGDEEFNHALGNGGRLDLGIWLDRGQNFAVEAIYFALGERAEQLAYPGTGTTILARPFFNADHVSSTTGLYDGGQNDALVLNGTGSTGSFLARSSSDLQGGEILMRWAVLHSPAYRIDMLAGYRALHLDDHLGISDTTTLNATGDKDASNDEFDTRNYFNGLELGMKIEQHVGRWSLESLMKLGVGDTHSRVLIDGSTVTTAGTTDAAPVSHTGGLLALPSNMGLYGSDRFSVAPELGVTLGCDLTCKLRATVGYTFLFWSGVARPGDQIDTVINGDQIPPPNPLRTTPTPQPNFVLHTTDYWAQGLNFGLDYRF